MVKHYVINLETKGYRPTFFDLTEEIIDKIKESGIENGIVLVQTSHTTCSVFFEEFTHDIDVAGYDYLQVDLLKGLNKMFPKQITDTLEYRYPGPKHLDFALQFDPNAYTSGIVLNGEAHLRATLIGSSCSFSLINGSLNKGDFGRVYFADWDGNRARKRTCNVTIIGE
jgi:secondary thiamine-phosphate synthase enzyme